METTLHEFMHLVERLLVRKKPTMLQMLADRIKKTKVFDRNFECQIMGKKNAIRSESVLNQNPVKVYTDGSKPNGRVGAGFCAEYPNNSPKQAVFHLRIRNTLFQAEVLAISEEAKNLLLQKMHKVLLCWWIVRQLLNHS